MKKLIYIVLILLSFNIYGQNKAPQGTIEEAEFVIKKDKKNELPESTRLFKKAPLPTSTQKPGLKLDYQLYDVYPTFQPLEHKIKILRAKQDSMPRLYGNYLKLGHGNYYMPYVAAFLNNTKNDKYGYGLRLLHLSEGKSSYTEAHQNEVELHGKILTEKFKYTGDLAYNWQKYPFIHVINNVNNTENDPSKQHVYHQAQLQASFCNRLPAPHLAAPIDYQVELKAIHFRNHESIQESQGKVLLAGGYRINEIFSLDIISNLHLIQYKNPAFNSLQRFLGHFKPILVTKFNDFELQAGTNLSYQNDKTALAKTFDVYPELKLSYDFHQAFRPYLALSGMIKANSWQDYTLQNPWLASSLDLRHTNQNYIFHAGTYSDILQMLSCHVGLSLSNYQNWPCFVNHPTEPREFEIKYDDSATVFNVFTELTKISFAEALTTRVKGEYFYYKLAELQQAWHRPQYTIELLNTYNFRDKILLKGKLYWLGGMYALDPHTNASTSLPDIVDIGVGVEYLWNQRFSIFIDCQNILAKANNRYLHTPISGAHILVGVTYGW
jgi:hypothetical protein